MHSMEQLLCLKRYMESGQAALARTDDGVWASADVCTCKYLRAKWVELASVRPLDVRRDTSDIAMLAYMMYEARPELTKTADDDDDDLAQLHHDLFAADEAWNDTVLDGYYMRHTVYPLFARSRRLCLFGHALSEQEHELLVAASSVYFSRAFFVEDMFETFAPVDAPPAPGTVQRVDWEAGSPRQRQFTTRVFAEFVARCDRVRYTSTMGRESAAAELVSTLRQPVSQRIDDECKQPCLVTPALRRVYNEMLVMEHVERQGRPWKFEANAETGELDFSQATCASSRYAPPVLLLDDMWRFVATRPNENALLGTRRRKMVRVGCLWVVLEASGVVCASFHSVAAALQMVDAHTGGPNSHKT